MGHIWRIGSRVGWITRKNKVTRTKYFTFGKMGQTWQNGSHLEEWGTVEKMDHN